MEADRPADIDKRLSQQVDAAIQGAYSRENVVTLIADAVKTADAESATKRADSESIARHLGISDEHSSSLIAFSCRQFLERFHAMAERMEAEERLAAVHSYVAQSTNDERVLLGLIGDKELELHLDEIAEALEVKQATVVHSISLLYIRLANMLESNSRFQAKRDDGTSTVF